MDASSSEVTELLKAWNGGDRAAFARLTELVYSELHRMARHYMRNERQADTLQTTVLVHEAYLRLAGVSSIHWHERAQFYAVAAQMMRRILVDAARARAAHKRGGSAIKTDLDQSAVVSGEPDQLILGLHDALAAFAEIAPRQAKVVELRYFGGLSEDEIAATLELSPRTVRRDWDIAKAWLTRELSHT
jgi:RNA polymerase sigma factor (TIGR02999 family)